MTNVFSNSMAAWPVRWVSGEALGADRRAAIALAIREAAPGDIVLVAGKGHERVQISREGSLAFDDVQVALEELRQAGYECQSARAAAGKNA